jgi:hypothetical protein
MDLELGIFHRIRYKLRYFLVPACLASDVNGDASIRESISTD